MIKTVMLRGWMIALLGLVPIASSLAGSDHLPTVPGSCPAIFDDEKKAEEKPQAAKVSGHDTLPPTVVVPSGRDPDTFHQNADAAMVVTRIAKDLGLNTPPHVVEFAPAGQLAVLGALGRHAVPHAHDGAAVLEGVVNLGGLYEFVTPGCPTCRSFYRDTTPQIEQLSILMHVAGHNDFSATSMYSTSRPCDPIADSIKLAELMEDLYAKYDHDEVSRWYEFLQTLSELQDLTRGSFTDPESFRPDSPDLLYPDSPSSGAGYSSYQVPRVPTTSVLQAMVTNLPPGTPQWKKDMLALFERIERVKGFYLQNKIMNEGWATLMQSIIAQHSPWQEHEHALTFAGLYAGVVGEIKEFGIKGKPSNPYWLGLQAWKNLLKAFLKRPEIQGLPLFEQHKRFVAYAHENFIGHMNDYDFLRVALTPEWVHRQEFQLTRKAGWNEMRPNLPPPQNVENPEQKVVASTDPQRIVDYLRRKISDRRLHFPSIRLKSFNGEGRGFLELEHDVVDHIPLDPVSMVQALYVLSQIQGTPVSLKTVKSVTWEMSSNPVRFQDFPGPFGFSGFPRAPQNIVPRVTPTLITPIRIEVEPTGKIRVYDWEEALMNRQDMEWRYNPILTMKFRESIEAYQDDRLATDNDALTEADKRRFAPMVERIVDQQLQPGTNLFSHSPTAAKALLEYANLLKQRTYRALELIRSGKLKVRKTGKGVRFRVLSEPPHFKLDRKIAAQLQEALPPAPIDGDPSLSAMLAAGKDSTGTPDDNLDIGRGKGKPRDVFWGPGKPKGNGGQGDGDEDGEPADSDEEGDPNAGPGAGDPHEVEISLEEYGNLLRGQLELPNLKKKGGKSEQVDSAMLGSVRRPSGQVLWDRTAERAIEYGMLGWQQEGGTAPWDIQAFLQTGLKQLQPGDYVVKSREEMPVPDMNAVVVFVIDLTGSMMGRPQAFAKEWVFNAKAILKSMYPKAEFRFVGYSDDGIEMPESKIWKTFIGGGNRESKGLGKAKEILDRPEFNDGSWNKYVIVIGDGGSSDVDPTREMFAKLSKDTQYMAFVQTMAGMVGGIQQFVDMLQELSDRNEWFGFTQVDDDPGSIMESLKRVFSKGGGR